MLSSKAAGSEEKTKTVGFRSSTKTSLVRGVNLWERHGGYQLETEEKINLLR